MAHVPRCLPARLSRDMKYALTLTALSALSPRGDGLPCLSKLAMRADVHAAPRA